MNRKKSKLLYANSVMNAIGYLDDEFCTEAREFEPVSTETTFFHAKKVITAAAVFLFVVGACLLIPILLGNDGLSPVVGIFHSEDTADLTVSYALAEPGEYDLTVSGVILPKEFCFRIEGIEGDYRILQGEKDLRAEADADGFITVRLSDYPVGTGSITFRLSGVEGDLSAARVSTKLPGKRADASHTMLNS